MKKIILSVFTVATIATGVAKAEVTFDEKAFEASMKEAMIRADVKVWCGPQGQEFAQEMANSLRESKQGLIENQNKVAAEAQIEKSAQAYEGLCEKAVRNAFASGLSEKEIRDLIQN